MKKWFINYTLFCQQKNKEKKQKYIDELNRYKEYLMQIDHFQHPEHYEQILNTAKECQELLDDVTAIDSLQVTDIINNKNIETVDTTDELLILKTKQLFIKNYDIGNYSIEIKYNQIKPIIRNNVYKVYNDIDHPHIRDGTPCFGEWINVLDTYYLAGNINLYIDTLIRYLQSLGNDHGFLAFNNWIKAFSAKDDSVIKNVEQLWYPLEQPAIPPISAIPEQPVWSTGYYENVNTDTRQTRL